MEHKHHMHIRTEPPYVGGDSYDETTAYFAECCGCRWKGLERSHVSLAYQDAIDHLQEQLVFIKTYKAVAEARNRRLEAVAEAARLVNLRCLQRPDSKLEPDPGDCGKCVRCRLCAALAVLEKQ